MNFLNHFGYRGVKYLTVVAAVVLISFFLGFLGGQVLYFIFN